MKTGMELTALPAAETGHRSRPDVRAFITQQLRPVLENGSIRLSVVGILLVIATSFTLVPPPAGVDPGWMFIVPVAISAIAGGLGEGLLVALAASCISSLFGNASMHDLSVGVVLAGVPGR